MNEAICCFGKGMNSTILLSALCKTVGQTEIFNLGMTISLGEGIQTRLGEE